MISHPHKAIFIHIPKCGGQSVENAFLSDLGLNWANRSPLLLMRNKNPDVGPPRLAHLTAEDYLRYHYASKDLFDDYYSFAILRNPVDRVLSMFNYLKIRTRLGTRMNFEDFVGEWLAKQLSKTGIDGTAYAGNQGWFVRPQTDFVLDASDQPMVKGLFFLETINENFGTIREKCQLRSDLPHVNKSKKTATQNDLNPETRAIIRELYERDFAYFEKIAETKKP